MSTNRTTRRTRALGDFRSNGEFAFDCRIRSDCRGCEFRFLLNQFLPVFNDLDIIYCRQEYGLAVLDRYPLGRRSRRARPTAAQQPPSKRTYPRDNFPISRSLRTSSWEMDHAFFSEAANWRTPPPDSLTMSASPEATSQAHTRPSYEPEKMVLWSIVTPSALMGF